MIEEKAKKQEKKNKIGLRDPAKFISNLGGPLKNIFIKF